MNSGKLNSFMTNNKINNTNREFKPNKAPYPTTKKTPNIKNKYQSDKKLKPNNSPYYIIHKNIGSSAMSAENQKILLHKRELEIKDLKIKCQKLEQENHKYQLQNILLKNNYNNNKNNDLLSNNTSSNFPIRNEIKKLWENFAKVEILNNFIDFENEPELIYHLICELILLSDKMIKQHCLLKYKEILKIMGVKNNSVIIKDIETQFKNFMKEHLNEIFNNLKDKSFINDYKRQFKDKVKNIINCINENNMMLFDDILEQYEFNDMLKNINDIILFTQFNEPTLYFQIEEKYEKRKIKYLKIIQNKNDFIIINNNFNDNNNNYIILLEPPCLKSGFVIYDELKPILMKVEQKSEEEDKDNNIEEYKIETKLENINNGKIENNEFLNIEHNYNNNKEIIEEKIKFNSINNTSRMNRNLNINTINNDKKSDYNYINYYTNDNYNTKNKKIFNNNMIDKKNIYFDININKDTIDKDSFYEENNHKNINSINSSRPKGTRIKKIKQFKKLSISKDIISDEPDFCSTEENVCPDNKQSKSKQIIKTNHPLNKKYNKIHRIKSANYYFDNNKKKLKNQKNIFSIQNTNLIRIEEANKIYNNYKQFINNKNINNNNNNNNIINNGNSEKNIFMNSSDGNQSLSNDKNIKNPLIFKKYIKNKKLSNKNYYSISNNKEKNPSNIRKGNTINIKNSKISSNDNKMSKNNKTKTNVKTSNNLYKNAILLMNKIINKDIITPSKSNKSNKKEKIINKKQYRNQNMKKNINIKSNKIKTQNLKINYSNNNSNSNILNNNVNSNTHFSNLSSNRTKPCVKRIDSFDQKNLYSTLEEIKKMIDDGNHLPKPIIMIPTNYNNNNNTINVNKNLKIKYHNFNKKNKHIGKKYNYNTINNSIKQLISLSQPKIIENENNNNLYSENKYKNTKSLENINYSCHNKKNHINNKGIYYKQFSIDETTFNISTQFNLTLDFNNKANNNHNLFANKNTKIRTLPNEFKNKFKYSFTNNMKNNNCNKNKNKIKAIEINIEGLNNNKNNNYNTINAQSNKKRYQNYFHIFEIN